jgi:flagellar biosynthesis protein
VLSTLDLGQDIPESLYFVIAELLAYSYVLQGKIPPGWEGVVKHINYEV